MTTEFHQVFSKKLKSLRMRDLYRFDDLEVDLLRRELRRDEQTIPLSGKPFDVLLALLEWVGQVVSKDDLLKARSGPTASSRRPI